MSEIDTTPATTTLPTEDATTPVEQPPKKSKGELRRERAEALEAAKQAEIVAERERAWKDVVALVKERGFVLVARPRLIDDPDGGFRLTASAGLLPDPEFWR